MPLDLAAHSLAGLNAMRSRRTAQVSHLEAKLRPLGEELKRQEKELRKAGYWVAADGTVFLIGLLGSPFTGGVSLLVALYGGGRLAMDGYKSAKMVGPWRETRRRAEGLRQRIAKVREELEDIEAELERRASTPVANV